MNVDALLGLRAVACKRWRWLPGMRDMNIGARALLRPSGSGIEWIVDGRPSITPLQNGMVPDLRDPCTLGGLLGLVRAAYETPTSGPVEYGTLWVHVARLGDEMVVYAGTLVISRGRSEAEALVYALERASNYAGGAQ